MSQRTQNCRQGERAQGISLEGLLLETAERVDVMSSENKNNDRYANSRQWKY